MCDVTDGWALSTPRSTPRGVFRAAGWGPLVGVPQIMVWTLANATHARGKLDLMPRLRALSLRDRYERMDQLGRERPTVAARRAAESR